MPDLTPEKILARLQPIFQDALDAPDLRIDLQSSAKNIADWDSLAHIDIIEGVERRFNVKFGLAELQDLKDVGDLVSLVIKKSKRD